MSRYQGQGKRMSRGQRVHVQSYRRGKNKTYNNYGTISRALMPGYKSKARKLYKRIKSSGKAKRYVNRFR